MKKKGNVFNRSSNRRAFFKNSAVVAGAATLGGGLLTDTVSAFAQDDGGFPVTRGDIAILRFLSALEQVEADYDRHARAARALAEEHFDAVRILRGVLETALA